MGKLIDNKRRLHADKILQKVSKKGGPSVEQASPSEPTDKPKRPEVALREQYEVIRNDIMKLRDDLSRGYELAKGMMDKGIVKELLRSR